MEEVKKTVAQFVKYERNQKILDKPERLWYHGKLKGGCKMNDIDELIFGKDFDKHSRK